MDDPGAGPRASVLVIEDNATNLILMERILAMRPQVQMLSATTGGDGLELARQEQPALVLLDLNLPGLGGDEVLRLLRADPRTAGLTVVIVSGDASPATHRRVLDLGASGFLAKPFDIQQLLALVDAATSHE